MLKLPNFDEANAQSLSAQTQAAMDALKAAVSELRASSAGTLSAAEAMQALLQLEEVELELERSWGLLLHLNSVTASDELRAARAALQPQISELMTKMGQDTVLFGLVQRVIDDQAYFSSLSQARQMSLQQSLLGFKLSGIELSDDDKARFEALQSKLSQLSSKFSDQVLDATQAFVLPLEEDRLKGLPHSALQLCAQAAKEKQVGTAYAATLDVPVYLSIMTYADDRSLREELYHMFASRASSGFAPAPQYDNGPVMGEILALRREKAQLLGFSSYAELSLERKMASTPSEVIAFLEDLATRARPFGERDMAELQEEAALQGIEELKPWDVAYLSEKIRAQKYNLSQEMLRPYFPFETVKNGLFEIAQRLFGVSIQQAEASVWHPDVTFYEVTEGEHVIGGFYLDPFARSQKRGGAWMNNVESRFETDAGINLPVVYLVCNLTPPTDDEPSCLTFDEVTTLFHEFGHGLHHLFSEVDAPGVSGVNGVEWDAVELPSQLMENWALIPEGLEIISAHKDTGEALPKELLEAILKSRFFQSGYMTMRQIEFALFDMRLHERAVESEDEVNAVLDQVRKEVSLMSVPPTNRFAHSFSHIFAGGYAAGYYSYKWAELLAFDTFERFEEEGLFSKEVGLALRQSILSKGGSRAASENFAEFRGRAPKLDAMLRHSGFQEA